VTEIEVPIVYTTYPPGYETAGAAGADLRAVLDQPLTIQPGERALIPTGIRIELPAGVEAQIRPRSGLALKKGLTLLNAPGTIDSDYRGEIKIIVINLGNQTVRLETGDRIAQMVLAPVLRASFVEAPSISTTRRGEGGFGSTGT
jgi:dUTP pyrophosphatase